MEVECYKDEQCIVGTIKGLVHPEIKTCQHLLTPMWFFNLFCGNLRNVLLFLLYLRLISMGSNVVWFRTFFKISSFLFHKIKYASRFMMTLFLLGISLLVSTHNERSLQCDAFNTSV